MDNKQCDRLFYSGQFHSAIALLFPASANLVPSQYIANLFNINFVILAVIGLIL
jgi:hypothetical protein